MVFGIDIKPLDSVLTEAKKENNLRKSTDCDINMKGTKCHDAYNTGARAETMPRTDLSSTEECPVQTGRRFARLNRAELVVERVETPATGTC